MSNWTCSLIGPFQRDYWATKVWTFLSGSAPRVQSPFSTVIVIYCCLICLKFVYNGQRIGNQHGWDRRWGEALVNDRRKPTCSTEKSQLMENVSDSSHMERDAQEGIGYRWVWHRWLGGRGSNWKYPSSELKSWLVCIWVLPKLLAAAGMHLRRKFSPCSKLS